MSTSAQKIHALFLNVYGKPYNIIRLQFLFLAIQVFVTYINESKKG